MLKIRINSFSYKREIPSDPSENGGGFVFDCRAIHNPGRYEEYKQLTGKDQPVIDFFNKDGEIHVFLKDVFALVERSVERYLERDFENLMVNFGCTGGQHRSVFSAEALANRLQSKYPIEIELHHIEQELKGRL